jgi:FKBP-type peptidyl-prolyl cis-trans isomerase 2
MGKQEGRARKAMDTVQFGKTVCLDYTLSLANGALIDSAQQSGTWTYVHGQTQMPSGLVKGVEGLGVGDHVRLELAPADAFGVHHPEALQQFPKERFPTAVLRVGFEGELPGPGGSLIPYRICAIDEDMVTLDFNHPLAGQHVVFEVTVVHIQT